MKIFYVVLAVIIVVIVGFFALNQYIYNEKQGDGSSPDLGAPDGSLTPEDGTGTEQTVEQYFYDRMITLGIEDIGHPIEGFDANLLMRAYPGLESEDFDGVEAFEGYYEIQSEEAVFVRGGKALVTSAESTVSEEGYATLLSNLATRLNISVDDKESVDVLIEMINTGERIEAMLGREKTALGVAITPLEVLEDSRCPIDVTCIQAGTVRVRAMLESGLGTAEQEFELETPITTEAEEVTLIQVVPFPESEVTIDDSDYVFTFEVVK